MYRARDTVRPMARLRFGCSGWDYHEWVGPFYRNASESKLAAYARVFDTAEINSTFYRAPTPGMVLGWGKYTPDAFVFAAKVPQTVTHDRLLEVARGADVDLKAFCELMRPLLDQGKLGPLLLQLPPRLRFEPAPLRRFLDTLPRDFTFALEPRNRSWMALEAFDLLRDTGVAYAIVDEPLLPPDLHVTAGVGYVRWHGHGQEPWYNYRYPEEQLEAWVPRVQQVASQAETVYGFFNNHYHGYAPENCLQILRMLGMDDADKARALGRIGNFRKRTSAEAVKVRATTLEDFGADPHAEAHFQGLLASFLDGPRLERAKAIAPDDVEITRDADTVLARVKDYRVELDRAGRQIAHDCDDWQKTAERREFCKHVGKFFLALPREEAVLDLEAIRADPEGWRFEVLSRAPSRR